MHAINNVAGLKDSQVDKTEPVLIGYKRTTSLENIDVTLSPPHEIYHQNRWARRMTAEEFKRFSAIPEEKRRSGINSIILTGSNDHLSNRPPAKHSSLNQQDIEMQVMKKQNLVVDVVVEEGHNSSKEDSPELVLLENSNKSELEKSDKTVENYDESRKEKLNVTTREQNGTAHFSRVNGLTRGVS